MASLDRSVRDAAGGPADARPADATGLAGLVLAAGAGSRYGRPKALVRDEAGVPWIETACAMLKAAGCTSVTTVLGASAEATRELVPAGVAVVTAPHWADGLGESLRTGLEAISATDARAVLITLVDLPGLPVSVARRVLGGGALDGAEFDVAALDFSGPSDDAPDGILRQATYGGRPGHPVLIGRAHWPELSKTLGGDVGARPYLRTHGVAEVECSDLWHGDDVDRPS